VSDLRFEQVQPKGREIVLDDWLHVHNLIIPTAPLSIDEVQERAQRNHLEVAYLEVAAVGCSTVRTPSKDTMTATVIARVRPEHRRRGFGEQMYQRGLAKAWELGAQVIETVVLESNDDGLRFAHHHGFVEIKRYLLPEHTIPFVELRSTRPVGNGGSLGVS
jgi:GNAT superfamily N-acetyltransferase